MYFLKCFIVLTVFVLSLSGKSEGTEQTTSIEPPKGTPVAPKKAAKARDPKNIANEKEKAAAEKLARQEELATEDRKYQREYNKRQIEIQEKMAELTGSLVRVGFFQVLVAGIGLGAIWVAYKSAKTGQIASDAAKEGAKAAKVSAQIARESLEISQRARIRIKNVSFEGMGTAPEEDPVVSYELENTGNLPATGLIHRVWYETQPQLGAREKGQWEILYPRASSMKRRWLLKDSYSEDQHESRDFAQYVRPHEDPVVFREDWGRINDSLHPILIGISVVYWDGFENERVTESCYRFNTDNGCWGHEQYRED